MTAPELDVALGTAPPSDPGLPGAGSTITVVVVGSLNTDQIVRVERRPGIGETVGDGAIELRWGGKGANQAVVAARCGASVAMVGRVGNDTQGHAHRAALADDVPVDISHVLVSDGAATGLAIVTVTPDGENSIVVAPGANHCLTPADVVVASPLIARARVLVVQLEIPVDAVARAVELAGDESMVVLNCAPFAALAGSVLSRVTVLVANEIEASALAGCPAGGLEDAFEAASQIVHSGPRWAVVTLGPLGAVVVGDGERVHVPAKTVSVVDTTGAGDAFVGALAAALSKGFDMVHAVRFGVDVGSETTTQHGARAVVPGVLNQAAPTE